VCKNQLIDGIKSDPNLLYHSQSIRCWKHDKNTLTRWHFDGNGADLFNISIQGSKQFFLSPPDSIPVLPLSSIALPYDFKHKYSVKLTQGDMLYIPAYWFHKVLTLEDNTVNINYMFFNKTPICSNRNRDILSLHRLVNTFMCEYSHVCETMSYTHLLRAIIRGLLESLPFFLVLYFMVRVLLFQAANVDNAHYPMYIIIILGLLLVIEPTIGDISSGVSQVTGMYMTLWACIFIIMRLAIGNAM
jgi:hypothetical protein